MGQSWAKIRLSSAEHVSSTMALRVVERCSESGSAVPHLEYLKETFIERNYPEDLVESQVNKAKSRTGKI